MRAWQQQHLDATAQTCHARLQGASGFSGRSQRPAVGSADEVYAPPELAALAGLRDPSLPHQEPRGLRTKSTHRGGSKRTKSRTHVLADEVNAFANVVFATPGGCCFSSELLFASAPADEVKAATAGRDGLMSRPSAGRSQPQQADEVKACLLRGTKSTAPGRRSQGLLVVQRDEVYRCRPTKSRPVGSYAGRSQPQQADEVKAVWFFCGTKSTAAGRRSQGLFAARDEVHRARPTKSRPVGC